MPLEWPVGVSRPCERASFVHGRGCESDLSTPLGPVGTPVNRLRGRYSPVAVSTLSLRDPADPPPEGTSREQALAANSGNVWQTSNADFAVNPGFGNVWQRVEKPPPNFASRRSPVRSRLAPLRRPANERFLTLPQLVARSKEQASVCSWQPKPSAEDADCGDLGGPSDPAIASSPIHLCAEPASGRQMQAPGARRHGSRRMQGLSQGVAAGDLASREPAASRPGGLGRRRSFLR